MKTIFAKGNRKGHVFNDIDIDQRFLRKELLIPDFCETDVVRHYVSLERMNHGVDNGFYPLGSCTMKYNPKVNEWAASLFASIHPLTKDNRGCLTLMTELSSMLCKITGMAEFTLSPAAGAHGELTGVMILRKHFGDTRSKILIPDSAHGTNPASAALCGFSVVEIKSDARGNIDLSDLKEKMADDVAGLMVTNPNTLGLFDENIMEVTRIVHENGGLVYCDGANMNPLLGRVRPADFGADIIHLNLHKTFSTPHGGGGPGSGPVGVVGSLRKYLPVPRIVEGTFSYDFPDSIGQMRSFWSNFGVLVKAYCYFLALGEDGLYQVSEYSVLNANYLKNRLKKTFHLPFDRPCMHEFVICDEGMPNNVTTNDIAKRLIDFGIHPPTVYFPLIVKGAMMIEPTETESKETLDKFCEVMEQIRRDAEDNPEILKNAPNNAPVRRLDAVKAAREPILREIL
ncbi:glycine dehydrogenase (aminomethyl-transferring) [Candidatus Woesearchaeota archaeon CG11_big_fil_rev_8_21_14_0_20_43_8]|nr:MAG: glycine dehydrogenase (aminomethyl-transferring) [Candidatus Woesearchaeota archaeon CG11_big_fil_rev_8_21_14_0_20_43_8]PIO05313.1 MAG: glycine dehydrogenase (aminomethyl-transferring) [Candidatus Woesearchaeota archaeon CG08_land_8_20_14_0_20_43_7]